MSDKVKITKTKLDNLANAVAAKSGKPILLTVDQMTDAVLDIITPSGTLTISNNGIHNVTTYASAKVNVQDEPFVISLSYDGMMWSPDKTYLEVDTAYKAGKTILVNALYEGLNQPTYFFKDSYSNTYNIRVYAVVSYDNSMYVYADGYTYASAGWTQDFHNVYSSRNLTDKTVTANAIYEPFEFNDGFSEVTVNVPSTTIQPLTVTPTTSRQTYEGQVNKDYASLTNARVIDVAIDNFHAGITLIEGVKYWVDLIKCSSSGSTITRYNSILWTATEEFSYLWPLDAPAVSISTTQLKKETNNEYYIVEIYSVSSSSAYSPVIVEPIPSEYIIPNFQSKTITPSTLQQTITADSNYNGLSSVTVNAMPNGTAGTPVAIKGTVSNNSITVTPSVTNTTGYITGGTKTGTAVTVSASELVSGTYNIISSGTKDITNYKNVSISSGTATVSATKGTVSNNSITVTPSVTTTEGYINANTSTGTAVTVSASELVSGTYSITENNTYDVTNIASVVVNVPTGNITQDANGYLVLDENGSSSSSSKSMNDPIRFFDYDGTLVASYDSVPSSLPMVPTHTGLTNGTWNYTLTQITTQFNAMGICDVGVNYDTVSGATEIDIKLQDGRLHPYLSLAINGTITIDWGDNSTSTATGTSLTSRKSDIHHEYAAAGSYTIKIIKTSGTGYSLYCTEAYTLLNKNSSTTSANRVYSNCVQSVRIGENCTIGNYAFCYCYSLMSISMPSSITNIGTYAFYYCYSLMSVSIPTNVTSTNANTFGGCYSLTSVSIPSGVTSIGSSTFSNCSSLISVSIPSGVTNINSYAFSTCYSLASIFIPSGVTSIGRNTFAYCQSLASVSIPSGVTSIGTSAFYNCYSLTSFSIPSNVAGISGSTFSGCYGIAEYHFEPTTPPTLANTNAFTNISSDCIIYVPYSANHSILTAYQTAENWSTYASYMVEESE